MKKIKKPKLKLLIVEDNIDDALILKEMISEMNIKRYSDTFFEAAYRECLSEGIQYIKSHSPDIVLLDLNMPDSSGLNTLQLFRQTVEGREVPVIILTNLADKETGIEAVKMGAQEYLVKGDVTARTLGIAIRFAIERNRLKLQLEKETESLRQREEYVLEIITNTPDGVVIVDSNDMLLYMNPAAEDLFGRKCKISLEKPFAFPMITNECESREIEIPIGEGEAVILEMRGVKIDWRGNDAWLLSLRDITRKKRMLESFSQEKERLDITLRSIADGVITTNQQGVIQLINWMAEQMTGWTQEDAVGKPLKKVLTIKNKATGDFLENPREELIKRGEAFETNISDDWILISGEGTIIPIEFSCNPVLKEGEVMGAVLVIRDVTEKKELEQDLVRSQNLESLGILARGIAHEYNNILTATLGYISLAKAILGKGSKILPKLKKAEDAGLRAKEVSYRLFTFSKGGEPQKRRSSIVKTLRQAVDNILKEPAITTSWHIDDDLWPVIFDPNQVLLAAGNILKNAAEASGKSGLIEIKVNNSSIPGKDPSAIKRGNYIEISITDQGNGIPEDNQDKIFDPYFTTKENAEGIGLTTAYSIIRKHGGWIGVKSNKNRGGGGTTVTFLLPAAVAISSPKITTVSIFGTGKGDKPFTEKKKKILVMDDEDLVREIAGEMLEFLGYEAIFAEDGEEALELYRSTIQSGDFFEAVILDLVIPAGMGGKTCVRKLLEIDPGVKAIVSSGYSDDPVIADYQDYGFRGVLPKPYQIHELRDILENLV